MSNALAVLLAGVLCAATADLLDPTAPPTAVAVTVERAGPQLQAILRAGDHELAVIDGARVHVGERIGEWTLIEISARTVRLRSEHGEQTLRLAPAVRQDATTGRGTP